ncbi:MAG: prepilin-type N-terminal cleavage/methylation domain-containing protein [Candidatus Saccharimonadales bacterium]
MRAVDFSCKNKQGFTLVELLIAISMFTVVLLLVVATFTQINRSYTKGITTKTVHEEGRSALSALAQDFRTTTSSNKVSIDCGNQSCNSENAPTEVFCYDDKAYVFQAPQTGSNPSPGSLIKVEGTTCSEVDLDRGVSVLGSNLQPQFFKVIELVPNKTYKLELALSTSDYQASFDLLEGIGTRDVFCDPAAQGNQYCEVVYLTSTVTLRGN